MEMKGYVFSMRTLSRTLIFILCLVLLTSLTGCATPLIKAAVDGDIQTVRTMLDSGADVNDKGGFGTTALCVAAQFGHADIVRMLLDAGANVNAKQALGLAAWKGHADIVRMLLDAGVDPGVADLWGKTPLRIAQEEGHTTIARMLKEAEEERYMAVKKQSSYQPPSVKSDVDELPVMQAKLKKNAYAIVIGVEKYRQKLPKADYADNDARIMAEYLTKVMGYPEENIVTLLNDRALKSDLEKYLGKWLPNNVEKDSSVFIYYSGHGAPNPKTGDAFLVPYDGDPSFIEETGYPLKRLYAKLDMLQVKEIIVVLDSCFSGAGGRSVLAKGARPLVMNMDKQVFHSDRIAILSASSGSQISSTHEEKGHGLFTYFLLKGLKGDADTNNDGTINMGELYGYAKPNVERIARKAYNNEQSPQLIVQDNQLIQQIIFIK